MTEEDSGRPPAETFHTVADTEQARLLSNRGSFRFFEPFIAKEQSATAAAAEVGCALDTMLYRIKTFLRAGLLQVAKLEKRAGRPVKHYRSAYDAYFIPFEVTPFANLEERMREHYRSLEAVTVPAAAKLLRKSGLEGYEFYRHAETGTVWGSSAARRGELSDLLRLFHNPHDPEIRDAYRGMLGGDFNSELYLTYDEAKALMLRFYELRSEAVANQPKPGTNTYLLSVRFLPLEP